MRVLERDFLVLRGLDRWRFALSRQVRDFADFPSQRTCDRRVKALIEMGLMDRKHVLYGVPCLLFLTHKGKVLLGVSTRKMEIRVDRILHDIAVLDAALYLARTQNLRFEDITTEKELHQKDGFSSRQHRPDFIFARGEKTVCAEVELTTKAKTRFEKIVQSHFLAYDVQLWVVPKKQTKIKRWLDEMHLTCPNIEQIDLEEATQNER